VLVKSVSGSAFGNNTMGEAILGLLQRNWLQLSRLVVRMKVIVKAKIAYLEKENIWNGMNFHLKKKNL